jgi:hypothetical protein
MSDESDAEIEALRAAYQAMRSLSVAAIARILGHLAAMLRDGAIGSKAPKEPEDAGKTEETR